MCTRSVVDGRGRSPLLGHRAWPTAANLVRKAGWHGGPCVRGGGLEEVGATRHSICEGLAMNHKSILKELHRLLDATFRPTKRPKIDVNYRINDVRLDSVNEIMGYTIKWLSVDWQATCDCDGVSTADGVYKWDEIISMEDTAIDVSSAWLYSDRDKLVSVSLDERIFRAPGWFMLMLRNAINSRGH